MLWQRSVWSSGSMGNRGYEAEMNNYSSDGTRPSNGTRSSDSKCYQVSVAYMFG